MCDSEKEKYELVFATVGPIGSCLTAVGDYLERILVEHGFHVERVRISDLMRGIKSLSELKTEESFGIDYDQYIKLYQDAGDAIRIILEKGEALAGLAIKKIEDLRGKNKLISKTAYIIHTLKHPEEVNLLRRAYGSGFFLIGSFSDEKSRINRINKKIKSAHLQHRSKEIINRDYCRYHKSYVDNESVLNEFTDEIKEKIPLKKIKELRGKLKKFGQNVQETFPQSDLFVIGSDYDKQIDPTYSDNDYHTSQNQIHRFVKIILGYPYHTPFIEEYAMAHAWLASLRSSHFSRQVGCAITTLEGDILCLGTNEVPAFGGGLYWEEKKQCKSDFRYYENLDIKNHHLEMIQDFLEIAKKYCQYIPEKEQEFNKAIYDSDIMKIGEFDRSVHAEMAAITDAASRGISIKNSLCYCTTYPCHNCIKHILSAGIKKVIFIFPYSKSKATTLFEESVQSSSHKQANDENKLDITPFTGISPKRYFDFFSMTTRKEDSKTIKWQPDNSKPRPPFFIEKTNIDNISKEIEKSFSNHNLHLKIE